VYHEKDDAYFLSLYKTKSERFLILELTSQTTSEIRFLDADSPEGAFKIIHPRQHEMEYYVEHHGDKLFIITNENAPNFKLMEAPLKNPAKQNWKEILPHQTEVKIDKIDVFRNHLVVYEREKGLKQICISDLRNNNVHFIEFPEPVYTYYPTDNVEFDSNLLRFTYSSLTTPKTVYDYNLDTRERELKKVEEVPGGYDPAQYQSERIFAKADDGTKIPISLVYKKGMEKNGSNPLFLYGYGSYGYSSEPYFTPNRLSLLDRGFVYAIAHIRGGGEMGRYWYDEGKLLNKRNTFRDFINCAEHLVNEKYTASDKLVINGGSAGGLLMGAVVNMRPDLFRVVIANVPFVDVMNTMLDASIPLTVIEYEEWGNPNTEEYYHYLKSYSPYDNVETKVYPQMLITGGLNDARVQYWEPAKWAAKLRALKTDNNILLLQTNMSAGHSGASGRYDALKEAAFEYVFALDCLGIKN
jgi:oligopeptidase B